MKKLTKISIVVLLFCITNNLFGQVPKLLDPNNSPIFSKCYDVKIEGFNWWKCDSLHCDELFTTLKPFTGLGVHDSMVPIKTWEDSVTLLKHVKYQQYYKGILMENVHYVEHSLNCNVLLSNGFICEGMDKSAIPIFTEAAALQKAIEHVGVDRKFAWQDDTLQYYLLHDSESTYTTYYPTGELLWAHIGDRAIKPVNFKLAWKFRIWVVDSPNILKYIYVDATNGSILKDPNVAVDGTFNHLYYGSKTIDTRWYGGLKSKYFLEANDDGRNIRTKDKKFDKTWKYVGLPDDQDDNWGNDHWAATASHWATQESWSYWRNVWKRNGIDNNGRPLKILADYPDFNAYFLTEPFGSGADGILIGRFDLGLAATLDIVGHEYAHGITYNSANLEYLNESGALNESYSDIFGFLTERHHFGFRNWTHGEDCSVITVRDLQNPKNTVPYDPIFCLPSTHPNYYLESGSWHTGTCDYGGVHHNSAVQNQCFYFLAMGGTQLGITVSGIGIDKAAQIVEYALVNGLVLSTTNYVQNRECWVTAAKILFGECSNEQFQTCRAWAACNIGTPCPCEPPPVKTCWQDRFRYLQAIANPLTNSNQASMDEGVILYPNPATDKLNINFNGLFSQSLKANKIITITNVIGAEMKKVNILGNIEFGSIDISYLKAGTYFVQIEYNGIIIKQKFIKL